MYKVNRSHYLYVSQQLAFFIVTHCLVFFYIFLSEFFRFKKKTTSNVIGTELNLFEWLGSLLKYVNLLNISVNMVRLMTITVSREQKQIVVDFFFHIFTSSSVLRVHFHCYWIMTCFLIFFPTLWLQRRERAG